MSRPEQTVARFVVLTEDSGKQANEVAQSVVKRSLQVIDPDTRTHRLRMDDGGADIGSEQRTVLQANRWKEKRRDLVALRKQLASLLNAKEPTWVVWHVDGDCTWSSRSSPHVGLFDDTIRAGVRALLASKGADPRQHHLIVMMPYYSIESWLFHHLDALDEVGPRDRARQSERSEFPGWDEVEQPKRALTIRDTRNDRLARSFPADRVRSISPSFAEFVVQLNTDGIRSMLRDTRA